MAFLGRFDAPDRQDATGCDAVAPRRRLAWRILYALALIALALWFGHGAEAQVPPPRGATPQYAYAHPMFWAPFSLVGDGN